MTTTTNQSHEFADCSNEKIKLGIREPRRGVSKLPGRGRAGSGGEEGDGGPIVLRSNLILSQLLRQIRSRDHGCPPALIHATRRDRCAFNLLDLGGAAMAEISRVAWWSEGTWRRNGGMKSERASPIATGWRGFLFRSLLLLYSVPFSLSKFHVRNQK